MAPTPGSRPPTGWRLGPELPLGDRESFGGEPGWPPRRGDPGQGIGVAPGLTSISTFAAPSSRFCRSCRANICTASICSAPQECRRRAESRNVMRYGRSPARVIEPTLSRRPDRSRQRRSNRRPPCVIGRPAPRRCSPGSCRTQPMSRSAAGRTRSMRSANSVKPLGKYADRQVEALGRYLRSNYPSSRKRVLSTGLYMAPSVEILAADKAARRHRSARLPRKPMASPVSESRREPAREGQCPGRAATAFNDA